MLGLFGFLGPPPPVGPPPPPPPVPPPAPALDASPTGGRALPGIACPRRDSESTSDRRAINGG